MMFSSSILWAFDSIHVVGTWNNWDTNEVSLNQSSVNPTLWHGIVPIDSQESDVEFKFIPDNSWDIHWGASQDGELLTFPVSNTCVQLGYNCKFAGPMDASLYFEFNTDTLEYSIKRIDSISVAGNWNGWNTTELPLDQSPTNAYLWSGAFPVETDAYNAAFKFVANGSWYLIWGASVADNTSQLPFSQAAVRKGYNIEIDGPMIANLRFAFNSQTLEYNITCPEGAPRYPAIYVAGTFNGWNTQSNRMTFLGGDQYEFHIFPTNPTETVEFKFVNSSAWWGETNQPAQPGTFEGIAETYLSANNIILQPSSEDGYLLRFNAATGGYSIAPATHRKHYVSLIGASIAPYATWETAANVIQDAVDVATDGDAVLVADGEYNQGRTITPIENTKSVNRVVLDKKITLKSVHGPSNASIVGQGPMGDSAVRCVYMGQGAILEGLTIKSGHTLLANESMQGFDTSGGGILATSSVSYVTNCILYGNSAKSGGGASKGSFVCCVISNNTADTGGGTHYSTLKNCTVTKNTGEWGGGCFWGDLIQCTISKNFARVGGGGTFVSRLDDCILVENSSRKGGGAIYGWLTNCVLIGNSATNIGGGISGGFLYNCILSSNTASSGGGSYESSTYNCLFLKNHANHGGGAENGTFYNCVFYENLASAGSGAWNGDYYNCIFYSNILDGRHVNTYDCFFSTDPKFVDPANEDYRLQTTSPCIDAGINQEWMNNATDFEGNKRIMNGRVDIGAYELGFPTDIKVMLEGAKK